jgi:hypothetical protein
MAPPVVAAEEVVGAGKLDEPGTRDLRSDPPPLLELYVTVVGPVEAEGGDPYRGQHRPGVDLSVHP